MLASGFQFNILKSLHYDLMPSMQSRMAVTMTGRSADATSSRSKMTIFFPVAVSLSPRGICACSEYRDPGRRSRAT